MTSKIVVNNIEADAGVSTVTFGSKISSTEFVGPVVGNVTGNLTGNVTSSGISTFSNGLNVTGGSVGIGTDNPAMDLEVSGNQPTVRINTTTTGYTGLEYSTNGTTDGGIYYNGTNDRMEFYTADTTGNPQTVIDASGRLLVGTTDSTGAQLFKVTGNSSSSINGGAISLTAGRTAPPNGATLGNINFGTETRPDGGAQIVAFADGAWTDGSSHPSGIYISTVESGSTSLTERMRISANGRTSIFTTDTDSFDVGNSNGTGTSRKTIRLFHSATAVQNGTEMFYVSNNGDVRNATGSYTSISDAKLKENIVDAPSQWDDIKALQVRKFNFTEESNQVRHTQIGLIAQEAELVCPGLVDADPDLDENGEDLGTVTKGVKYSVLYMKSVKALQEAMERIETLETANASQAATIAALDARLTALEGN